MTGIAALVAALVASLHPHHHHRVSHHHRRHRKPPVWVYAKRLTLHRWHHSEQEWVALDEIVRPESGWDPCASYPSNHDCGYAGPNACGIPQRDPCPYPWRGRLYVTRYAQVRDLIHYVASRYGDPERALWYHEAYGTY